MKLSQIKSILEANQLRLTRSLGQNFLHDANQLQRIIAAGELSKSDKVLEVGPGLGPLTELLLQNAGEVLAIEKDARLVEVLRKRFSLESDPVSATLTSSHNARFTLVHDDALEYLRRSPRDFADWKLIANLPYSVGSPILVELAQSGRGPQRLVVTLQLEVAKRLRALPADKDYGILTLLVQLEYEPLGWFKIPAGCFFPEPEVDSACVSLKRREKPLLAPEQRAAFVALVKQSFSQRRKLMLKLLKQHWPAKTLEQAFARLELPLNIRAEAVSLEHFVGLTLLLTSNSEDG